MGRNHWDAKRFHRSHLRRKPRNPLWGPAIFVALALVTGGVVATQGFGGGKTPSTIGVCHATGADQRPQVYLSVDRDSEDHALHATHKEDLVGVKDASDCVIADEASARPLGLCEDECGADLGLRIAASANASSIRFDVNLENHGEAAAQRVRLDVGLEQVEHPWTMLGMLPEDCTLGAATLTCVLDTLAPGGNQTYSLHAGRCEAGCGNQFEAHAKAAADNDHELANNVAVAVLVIEECPAQEEPIEEPTAPGPGVNASAPNETAEPEPPPAESPAANEGPSTNETNETDAPAPAPTSNGTDDDPAAPRADVGVAQRVSQSQDRVAVTITLRSLGNATARNVSLVDRLPEPKDGWRLSGADATACTLEEGTLECGFGDLDPGAGRTIAVTLDGHDLPCDEPLVSEAMVAAESDANVRNDRSAVDLQPSDCGDG